MTLTAALVFSNQNWLGAPSVRHVLDTALANCTRINSLEHGERLRVDVATAVIEFRHSYPNSMVIDRRDTRRRIRAAELGDADLGSSIVLELRGTLSARARIIVNFPINVEEVNLPTSNIPPELSAPIQSSYNNPLDFAAASLGIDPKEYKPMSAPDLAALMRDPKQLGEFLAKAVHTLNELPKLSAQVADATKAMTVAVTQQQQAEKLAEQRQHQIDELELRLRDAATKISQGSIATPNQAGQGNDLVAIASAMHISIDQLKAELASFVNTCALPLPNAVRWPTWCDPTDKSSPLPFCYRHSKPVFLAGESGTGKTFIAEALCMAEAGRRCAVTFHEKISYNKLFVRETVDGGKVRSVLGPVLLSLLTGTPIVLDEIDHADVFVQSLMHEVLDKRRVFIPELALSIVAEPGCKFIATGNSLTDDSGQYHGDVGTALRTRFAAIHVEYPEESIEADTVITASRCDKKVGELIARVFKALRGAVQEQKLAGPISVRESCAAGTLFVQAKQDKLSDDQALGLGLSLMVVQKRPPQEQLVAAEICATVAKVSVGAFQNRVKAAGKAASGKSP